MRLGLWHVMVTALLFTVPPVAAQGLAFRPMAPPTQQAFDLISANAGLELSGETSPSIQRLARQYAERSAQLCKVLDEGAIEGWAAEVRSLRNDETGIQLELAVGRTSILVASFSSQDDLATKVARLRAGEWIAFSGQFLTGDLFCLSQDGPLSVASVVSPVFKATINAMEAGANYSSR